MRIPIDRSHLVSFSAISTKRFPKLSRRETACVAYYTARLTHIGRIRILDSHISGLFVVLIIATNFMTTIERLYVYGLAILLATPRTKVAGWYILRLCEKLY